MTLKEELERVLSKMEDGFIRDTKMCVDTYHKKAAITAIEKLIDERYTPKTDVMEYVSGIHNLKYTAQEAYEIAEKWFSSPIPQEYTNEVLELSYKEKCLKALRNAFGIKKEG